MSKITCKCGAVCPKPDGSYPYKLCQETGWAWLPTADGGSFYLCPNCKKIVREHALAIQAICKDEEFLHFNAFIKWTDIPLAQPSHSSE